MAHTNLIFFVFRNFAIVAIITTIVVSCSNNPSRNNTFIKEQYYDDGTLLSRQECTNDSVANGFYIEYYRYGRVKYIANYDNNLLVGDAFWFYDTRKLECKAYYEEGVRKGAAYWYDEVGKITLYIFYDHLGRATYRLDYKNDGTIIEKGSAFPMILINNDTLSVGDTCSALIYTINPPHFENRKLFIKEMVNGEETSFSEVPITDEWYLLERKLDKEGEYSWQLTLEYDTPWGKKKYDTKLNLFATPAIADLQ